MSKEGEKNELFPIKLVSLNEIMGIRYLNHYLKKYCPNSIQCLSLADLNGKRLAIDASIYLHRYEAEGALMENMYLMLSLFRHYGIVPIFVFDGKSPEEKKAVLQKRKQEREIAHLEYHRLTMQLTQCEGVGDEEGVVGVGDEEEKKKKKESIQLAMEQLKPQLAQLGKTKIAKVKRLLRAFGTTYIEAKEEADEVCASLVINKNAWACLSDDTDMFVYGCPRVLRYFNLLNHTVVLYYTKGILQELGMSQAEFRQICVLSGTDYNPEPDKTKQWHLLLSLFRDYQQQTNTGNKSSSSSCFYDWIIQTNAVSLPNPSALMKIIRRFKHPVSIPMENDDKALIRDEEELQRIMEEEHLSPFQAKKEKKKPRFCFVLADNTPLRPLSVI